MPALIAETLVGCYFSLFGANVETGEKAFHSRETSVIKIFLLFSEIKPSV